MRRCTSGLFLASHMEDRLRRGAAGLNWHLQAYCLYRLSNFLEALAVLQGGDATSKPVARAQLEAQLHYRMGHNSDAIRVYHQLFKEHKVQQR